MVKYTEQEIIELRKALSLEARNRIENDSKIKELYQNSPIFHSCVQLFNSVNGVGDIVAMIIDLAKSSLELQSRLLEVVLTNYGYTHKELPNGARLTDDFIEILEKAELKRLSDKYE